MENTAIERQAQGERIFALDIGTRSVIGVVGEIAGELFHVLGLEQQEHGKRAMVDGQIEDIEQVARVANAVKEKLEQKLGLNLTHVCVAAAGRSLKTQKAICEADLQEKQPITKNQVTGWELEAVQSAFDTLASGKDESVSFSCVGYSVMRYYLDDYPISTLVDHRANKIKIEVVATFLPNEVIESLYEVTGRIGLSVSNLTLEPIAAMNAIIPQELRMLNLALVDIGAGTSDIAISDDGSVTAYTMVTLAGDEISESLVQHYLVDFATAEQIKTQLSQDIELIEFEDIIGIEHALTPDEIFDAIKDCAQNLCAKISDAILEINGKTPAAVFLVGGGSRLVNMAAMVAKQLDIPLQKVAVGGSNYMKKMLEANLDLTAAEYATPIGIAITAMNLRERSGITVLVNDKPVGLFKNSVITAMDALLMSGYKQNQLIGRSGKSVTFELDEQRIVARGGYPLPAQIQINGKSASLTTPISAGDELTIKPAAAGEDAMPMLSNYIENRHCFPVTINDKNTYAGMRVLLNGDLCPEDKEIHNLDVIQTFEAATVGQLCISEEIDTWGKTFFVNGTKTGAGYPLSAGDHVAALEKDSPAAEVLLQMFSDAANQAEANSYQSAFESPTAPIAAPLKATVEKSMRVTLNEASLLLTPKEDDTPYLFFDMLNYVDIDPSKPQGNIVLLLNGKPAEYLDAIHENDIIDIYWDGLL